jgi:hypothetical protein
MDLIIELLRKYEEEQNLKYNSLQNEINNIKKLHNNSSNIINTLTKEKEDLYEENKEMQNVSLIIRLTNEKISLKKENELLLRRIEFLSKKNNINDIEIIKESKPIKNFTIATNNRVNNVIESYTKNENNIKNIEITNKNIEVTKNIEIIKDIPTLNKEVIETKVEEVQIDEVQIDEVQIDEVQIDEVQIDEVQIDEVQIDEENVDEVKEVEIDEAKEAKEVKVDEENVEKINMIINDINVEEIKVENISENNSENNLESDIEEISYRVKKIKGEKYFIDQENIIYTITENNEVGEKIGEYILNKNNILKPKFY